MAASTFSPGGFSYAQAAKGRSSAATSQTPSSKVTSGTATPATGTFSELTPGSNWADDVEGDVKTANAKGSDSQASDIKANNAKDSKNEVQALQATQKIEAEESKPALPSDTPVERAKPEEAQQQEALPAPDMNAPSNSAAKEVAVGVESPSPSLIDGTSESKSAQSESWIADRTARQNSVQQSEKEGKKDKKSKEAPTPAPTVPIVLQEAPIPENIWAKRAAQNQQTKAATVVPKAAVTPKENQKPTTDARSKSSPLQNGVSPEPPKTSSDEQPKSANQTSKRVNEVRNPNSRVTGRTAAQGPRSDNPLAADIKDTSNGRREPVKASIAPPSVNDAVSWPTPDLAEKERKEPVEKDKVEKAEDDATPATKRKKQEWTHIEVRPTFVYETTGTNKPHERRSHPPANSDGTPRNGAGGRGGRGGLRRANGGERPSRSESSPNSDQIEGTTAAPSDAAEKKDSAAMPPPPAKSARGNSSDASRNRKEPSPSQAVNGHRPSQMKQQDDQTDNPSGISASNASITRPPVQERRRPIKTESESREEQVPRPIPRRSSVGAENGENGQRVPAVTRPPIRKVAVDNRQDNRSFGENRDAPFNAPPRGGKRGGRGRGGARDLANGHNGASPMNGSYGEFSPYGVPPSPSGFHASRGSHQFSHASPRGGAYRGNPRAQSIPVDPYYNTQRFGGFHGAQHNPPQLQQPWYGPLDGNGYPMSAPPYAMPFEFNPMSFTDELRHQIEYYFSEDNLAKDIFLRGQMDSQGFVFLEVIANFNRVKQMTQDKELIKSICMGSENIDVRVGEDGRERLRRHRDWEKYVLEMPQRHESAQNNGPERLEIPERPQLATNNIPPQLRGPQSAGIPGRHPFDRRPYDMDPYSNPFFAYGGFPPEMYGGGPMMGEEMRGRPARSPMHETVTSPVQQQAAVPSFGNAQENDETSECDVNALTVVVNMGDLRPSPHSAASRTFSNGSIDSRSTIPEPDTTSANKSKPMTNGDSHTNGTGDDSLSAMSSPTKPSAGDSASNVFWVKDREFPLGSLPPGLSSYPYLQLKEEALQQRGEAVTGTCPAKLSILYQFWCHFLIRNFNSSMYEEFQRLANEDARSRYNFTGMQNLTKFYSQSLTSKNHPLLDRVAKDYVDLVLDMPKGMKDAPFKELRTAWRDGALNLKHRKKMADLLTPELKTRLDEAVSTSGDSTPRAAS